MLLEEEIAEELNVQGIQVLTPSGYKAINKVYRTIPLDVIEITTSSGKKLKCSKHHLVATLNTMVEADTLYPGDIIITVDGIELVDDVIEFADKEVLYDITVDTEDGLFYADGILSHNSTTLATRQQIMSHIIPKFKSLYIAPFPEQVKTYARRYEEMESAFRHDVGKQNLYNKVYSNGSAVDMLYCLTSAEKARGKTVTECVIDEAQNMEPSIVPEILYTKTMSQIPTVVITGTALTVDTFLEGAWQESSMGMWHVRNGDNSGWINMYDKDVLMKVCDNPLGPTCPKTGKLLDVTQGFFQHQNKTQLRNGNVGFHVPQCIIQDIVKNPVQWGTLYQKIKTEDSKKVCQECFGIAVAEGSRELTKADLQALCTLTDSEEEAIEKTKNGYYKVVVSGCDWGGSDYNPATRTKTSYTVHCIIGLAPDGVVDILHYRQYYGMEYGSIVEKILYDHNRFNAQYIASDFGVGMAYNTTIRNRVPFNTHFIFGYVGPASAPVAEPKGDHMMNQLSLNRTEALSRVFLDIKKSPGLIRCRSWEEMQERLLEFLNIVRIPNEDSKGAGGLLYRRVNTEADDSLHAFTFAYMLMLLIQGEPMINDEPLKDRLRELFKSQYLERAGYGAATSRGIASYVISG